jgi:hypothetical protein
MLTQVVFLLFTLAIFTVSSNALYFPDGSHNRPVFPATGGSITLDPPSRIVRRQTTPSSTLQPTMSVNITNWADQTNQLCINAINVTSITNPAGMVPCYNVLSYDPNTGVFLSEVRLFQIASMEQANIMSSVTGSGVLLEFPSAEITSSPGLQTITTLLGKRAARLLRRQTSSSATQAALVDAFYMNGTVAATPAYIPISWKPTDFSISAEKLLTPTTATLNLNVSGTLTPFSMSDSMVMFVNGLFSPEYVQSNTTYIPRGVFWLNIDHQPQRLSRLLDLYFQGAVLELRQLDSTCSVHTGLYSPPSSLLEHSRNGR